MIDVDYFVRPPLGGLRAKPVYNVDDEVLRFSDLIGLTLASCLT